MTDELNTAVGDVFGDQLAANAHEAMVPCLKTAEAVFKGSVPCKETMKTFKQKAEEIALITAVIPGGAKTQAAMGNVGELVRLAHLFGEASRGSPEAKYLFIKAGTAYKDNCDDSLRHDLTFLIQACKFQPIAENGGESGEESIVEKAVTLKSSMLKEVDAMVTSMRDNFKEKLDALLVAEIVVPDCEHIREVPDITEEMLQEKFPMTGTVKLSETTIKMSGILRDVQSACSFMNFDVKDFMDLGPYRANHRDVLTFLCLG